MAIKNKDNKKNITNSNGKKIYGNPINKLWGRILVWILVATMALGSIATLVFVIIKLITKV